MMFFAEYNALRCGKEEEREAIQRSAKELNRNGRKGRKELKTTFRVRCVLRVLCGKRVWLNADG